MNLFATLHRLSNKTGAALAAIYVVSQCSIAALLGHTVGKELIPMQLSFTRPRFEAIVSGWTERDLEQLQHHFYLDFIHPVWYGLFLAWALAKTLPESARILVWLPVIAAACDLCENSIHALAVFDGRFRALDQPSIAISSTFAAVKWLLALLSVLIIVWCFIRGRARR